MNDCNLATQWRQYPNQDHVKMLGEHTLYMHIPILGNAGTDEKWEGIEDNLWNAGTHLSELTEQ